MHIYIYVFVLNIFVNKTSLGQITTDSLHKRWWDIETSYPSAWFGILENLTVQSRWSISSKLGLLFSDRMRSLAHTQERRQRERAQTRASFELLTADLHLMRSGVAVSWVAEALLKCAGKRTKTSDMSPVLGFKRIKLRTGAQAESFLREFDNLLKR